MRYFKMDATDARIIVWEWQADLDIRLSEFRVRGDSTTVVSTKDRLGEAMLRQVLIERGIVYQERIGREPSREEL
jgi:hypothetical protein